MTDKLTPRQAAIIAAYTGVYTGVMTELHLLAQELMERPVWTHEFASAEFAAQLKEKTRPLFQEICP